MLSICKKSPEKGGNVHEKVRPSKSKKYSRYFLNRSNKGGISCFKLCES